MGHIQTGRAGEKLVAARYTSSGYTIEQMNRAIRGGELDLVVTDRRSRIFVEVKVVDSIDDLDSYITPSKLGHLTYSIERYMYTYPSDLSYQLDVVFVQHGKIVEHYPNVTFREE